MKLLLGLGIPAAVAGCVLLALHVWGLVGPGGGLLAFGAMCIGGAVERSKYHPRTSQTLKAGPGSVNIQSGGDLNL